MFTPIEVTITQIVKPGNEKRECPIYLNTCLEKVHSNVHKSPVRARMRMPSYEITGKIYCTNGQRTPQLLEEELMFFPLTDARIRVSTGGDWWGANFVAVNRRQIFSLQCEEIRLGS